LKIVISIVRMAPTGLLGVGMKVDPADAIADKLARSAAISSSEIPRSAD
jgi:translation initiation factor 2 gamma subunit (eIF-2gamma)